MIKADVGIKDFSIPDVGRLYVKSSIPKPPSWRYGSSSVLSHLFAQRRLSGELFQMEKDFREKVQEKLPEGFTLANFIERPKSDEYQVVFAIISDTAGKLNIPFFSRLNLKNSARNLKGLGYRVAKSKFPQGVKSDSKKIIS